MKVALLIDNGICDGTIDFTDEAREFLENKNKIVLSMPFHSKVFRLQPTLIECIEKFQDKTLKYGKFEIIDLPDNLEYSSWEIHPTYNSETDTEGEFIYDEKRVWGSIIRKENK